MGSDFNQRAAQLLPHYCTCHTGQVYDVNLRRAFPAGREDAGWAAARPLIELIAAAREPITPEMAAALLSWSDVQRSCVLGLTGLLFPVREGKFHVFHKTILDYMTGEGDANSSVTARSETYQVERAAGHARFATGCDRWLTSDLGGAAVAGGGGEAAVAYWLQHGVLHLCHGGRVATATAAYASNLTLLRRRTDAKLLATIASDHAELARTHSAKLEAPTQMRRFVANNRAILELDGGAAVLQLAWQQPEESVVLQAAAALGPPPRGLLVWRNKPAQMDPCIATLAHKGQVKALAVSKTHIVGGVGQEVYVYDFVSGELLDELGGFSGDVNCVSIFEGTGGAKIVAAAEDGTIRVWGEKAVSTALGQTAVQPPSACARRCCIFGFGGRESESTQRFREVGRVFTRWDQCCIWIR